MNKTEPQIPDTVLTQRVADESVLLDLESQSYFGLDPVATVIWEGITDNKTEDEIVDRITAEFDVDAEVARRDLREFMAKLKEEKLVVVP